MPLSEKTDELKRLIQAFETEAGKFYPLTLSLLYVTQDNASLDRPFLRPNHAIMLWQYYGPISGERDATELAKDLAESDLQWGIRGAEMTCFGLLEGEGCELFLRMAQRAGTLFDVVEVSSIKSRTVSDIWEVARKQRTQGKQTAGSNDHPLAIWLNYLLYHLSLTNPGRESLQRITPDPFTLSLLALERLYAERSIKKVDKSMAPLAQLQFKVAMSFPGERRAYVSATVDTLRPLLPPDSVFYDYDYQAQLAKPNLDVLLQDLYRNRTDLIVIFLCEEYSSKQWCGLEWRAIRDLIKNKKDDQVMFVRFDNAKIDGVFSLDGYIDAGVHPPEKLASFIMQRLGILE